MEAEARWPEPRERQDGLSQERGKMEPGECKRGCKNKRVPERICAGKQAGKVETEPRECME